MIELKTNLTDLINALIAFRDALSDDAPAVAPPLPEPETPATIALSESNGVVSVTVRLPENAPCTTRYRHWQSLAPENSARFGHEIPHKQKTPKLSAGVYEFYAFDHIGNTYKTEISKIEVSGESANLPDGEPAVAVPEPPEVVPEDSDVVKASINVVAVGNIAKVQVVLSENLPCQTHYRRVGDNDWSSLKAELSSKWGTGKGHDQQAGPLAAGKYEFYSENPEGEDSDKRYKTDVVSVVIQQSETAPVQSIDGWDDSKPHGGRAIGIVTSGIVTGNSAITKYQSARSFLCTRSGYVTGFGLENRVLSNYQVKERLTTKKGHWLEPYVIMNNELGGDGRRGGYLLSNSYSVGNGGLQEMTLREDNNGKPSEKALVTAKPYIPWNEAQNKWFNRDFEGKAYVEAGKVYWLVLTNLNPPSHSIKSLSTEEAKKAEIDAGAVGINGCKKGYNPLDPDMPLGPFLQDFDNLYWRNGNGDWRYSDVLSWYSVTYDDGVEVGHTATHLSGSSAYRYMVEGNDAIRQVLKWDGPTTDIDRIATRFDHDKGANKSPMQIVVKDANNKQLAKGAVSYDADVHKASSSSDYWISRQTRHGISDLDKTVRLVPGATYYIEYTAPSNAGFILTPGGLGSATLGSKNWNTWPGDSHSQQSKDGGKNWKALDRFPDWSLPAYLIPVGVPAETSNP